MQLGACTNLTLCKLDNARVKQAQVRAGHANPGITLAVYADAMAGTVDTSPFGGNQGGNQVGASAAETSRNTPADELAESAQLRAVSS